MAMSSPMLAELSSGKPLGRSWGTSERCSFPIRIAEILDRRAAYDEVEQVGGAMAVPLRRLLENRPRHGTRARHCR